MTPERMRQIEDVFHAACELLHAEREEYLSKTCGSDEELRREVELLLASDGEAGSLVESPAYQRVARLLAGDQTQITQGMSIGHYEILSRLGAGGMGEVWRARDTQLKRDVAIKVLPMAFAQDADRLRRFEREARAASALNHPNIITIYEIGSFENTRFIVTELIDGQTLRQRMESSRMKLPEALKIAVQIASALAAAHDAGIIHRDIKPENVMLRSDGLVKVLDFGLAKLKPEQAASDDGAEAQTGSSLTGAGVVMGTVGYMSPEQVRGQGVDNRTDIFSFGVLLYEMLSGQRPFQGESTAETMAAIANEEPPELSGINGEVPSQLERIVKRCLEKQPGRRFQNASDLGFALEGLSTTTASRPKTDIVTNGASAWRLLGATRPAWLASALFILLALISLPFIIPYLRQTTPADSPLIRLSVNLPAKTIPYALALSPDGSLLAINVRDTSGNTMIYLRPLGAEQARKLDGTDGAIYPFWSPDSRSIGFFAGRKLKRIEASGGPAQIICTARQGRSGAWNRDGVIVFGDYRRGGNFVQDLYRVSATGGEPSFLIGGEQSGWAVSSRFPQFLPDGRSFIYYVANVPPERQGVYLGSLDSNEPKQLLRTDSNAVYAPPGYLLFTRERTLMAQAFDPQKNILRGEPFPVTEFFGIASDQIQPELLRLRIANGLMSLAVSENGILAFQKSSSSMPQLIWVDRNGKPTGDVIAEGAGTGGPVISPDGKRVVFLSQGREMWIHELPRGNPSLFNKQGHFPVWSPDSSRIVFSSSQEDRPNAGLYMKAASGAGSEDLIHQEANKRSQPSDWSPDGRFIVFTNEGEETGGDIWGLPLEGGRKPFRILQTEFNEFDARFSPNGKYFAYVSDETGKWEIYVRSFPDSGDKWLISSGGGGQHRWRRDGRELFYVGPDGKLMSVDVKTDGGFERGDPKPLFEIIPSFGLFFPQDYSVTPDGQRFVVRSPVWQDNSPAITVLVNWAKGLKR